MCIVLVKTPKVS